MVDGGFGQAKRTVCIFVVFSLQKLEILERVEEWCTHQNLHEGILKKKYVQSKGDLNTSVERCLSWAA